MRILMPRDLPSPQKIYVYIPSYIYNPRSIKVAISAPLSVFSSIYLFAVLMLLVHLVCYFIKLNVWGFAALQVHAFIYPKNKNKYH